MRNSAVTQPVALTCPSNVTTDRFHVADDKSTICSKTFGSSSSGYSRFGSGVIKTDFLLAIESGNDCTPIRMLAILFIWNTLNKSAIRTTTAEVTASRVEARTSAKNEVADITEHPIEKCLI